MKRILRLDQTFLLSKHNPLEIKLRSPNTGLLSIPTILFQKSHRSWLHHIPFKAVKVKENAWKGFMLLNLFKRFNANLIYNFIIGILFFSLFFLNSRLISFLYSQLGYTESVQTWQAVHLYTQNAFLLVGSISHTLRINQKSDWTAPDILYLVINDCLVPCPPVHENLLFH